MAATVTLRDASGRSLLTYLPGTRDGLPCADNAVLTAPAADVTGEVLHRLPGWLVSVSPVFGRELLSSGASLHRHAFTMALDLKPGMPDPGPPPGVRFTACDRPASAIQPAVSAAFPPGHPDHHEDDGTFQPPQDPSELEQLLAGTLVGRLLPCSLLGVDAVGVVVAGCLINELAPRPWITLMFRDPAHSPPGTGAQLLAACAARAGNAGIASIGLAVTAGNPAQRVYERAGFTVLDESFTVRIPGETSG
jgi:GNAT superfamily N-acetyltransferase